MGLSFFMLSGVARVGAPDNYHAIYKTGYPAFTAFGGGIFTFGSFSVPCQTSYFSALG